MGEVAEFYNGDRGPNYPKPSEIVEQGVPFINAGDLINGHIDYHNCKHITSDKFNQLNGAKLKINDIVYCLRGTIGKNGLVNSDANATIASSLVCIRPVKLRPLFLFQILNSSIEERQRKMVDEGAAQPNISATNLKKFLIPVPNDNEQEKIGEVFSKLNHLITLQQRKLEQLKQLKKAMLQQLFVDKNNKQPTLRFKNFKGDWKQHRLGEISTKVTTKNQSNASLPVFTNSAKDGIVNQEKFFDKQIANNTSNYYVVNNNDFVYNPRISKNAPFGPIRRNTLNKTGIMSPLYYIFSLSHNTDENFLSFYFLSSKWYKFMYENGDSGARSDRFAIKDKVFQQMPIKLPLIIEQTEIGKFLNYVNILISLQQTKLTQLTTLKKYLLQKMFI